MKTTLDNPMATPLEEAKDVLAQATNDDVLIRHSVDGAFIIEIRTHNRPTPAIKNRWLDIAEKMGERDFFKGKGDDVLKEIEGIRDNFSLRGDTTSQT